jgi:hypothetical protein
MILKIPWESAKVVIRVEGWEIEKCLLKGTKSYLG